jgi:hypothetical protein
LNFMCGMHLHCYSYHISYWEFPFFSLGICSVLIGENQTIERAMHLRVALYIAEAWITAVLRAVHYTMI